jgi:hypothetical protein
LRAAWTLLRGWLQAERMPAPLRRSPPLAPIQETRLVQETRLTPPAQRQPRSPLLLMTPSDSPRRPRQAQPSCAAKEFHSRRRNDPKALFPHCMLDRRTSQITRPWSVVRCSV